MINEGEKWANFLQNPRANIIKRYMAEILRGRYQDNVEIIDRISSTLATEKDLKDFAQLVGQIYQSAYEKSVNDHKEQLAKLGITTSIKINH